MPDTVTGSVEVVTRATVASTAAFPGGTFTVPTKDLSITYGSGSTSGNVDVIYANQVATGTTLTLTDSSLKDPLGTAIAFAHVAAIVVYNPDATHDATLSGTFLGDIFSGTPTITIKPGGEFVLADPGAGWAVGSGHTLVVGGTSALLNITLLGRAE